VSTGVAALGGSVDWSAGTAAVFVSAGTVPTRFASTVLSATVFAGAAALSCESAGAATNKAPAKIRECASRIN
jgi:hypothetical protein